MTETVPLDAIVWDPSIYPRSKWSTSTIDRYVDALEAGDEFPPVIVEAGTMRLLDGKHRLEAHRKAGRETIAVEARSVPDGMSAKHFAATLSARHGDRMSNADLKVLAVEDFEADPTIEMATWGRDFGVSKSTLHGWVGHVVNRGIEERRAKSWRLHQLGWTHQEIAELLDVSRQTIDADAKEFDSELSGIRDALAKGLPEADVASRWNRVKITFAWKRWDHWSTSTRNAPWRRSKYANVPAMDRQIAEDLTRALAAGAQRLGVALSVLREEIAAGRRAGLGVDEAVERARLRLTGTTRYH